MHFADKTVLLTGASSGIGAELARELAARGSRLILLGRRKKVLEAMAADLPAAQGSHLAVTIDLANPADIERLGDELVKSSITPELLILNAGISSGFSAQAIDMEKIEELFQVNFFSVVKLIQLFLPGMVKRKSGWIAVTSSLAGYRGMPGSADYAASKAALSVFAESMRLDLWQSGIGVTVISPGFVRTPMTAKHQFYMPFLLDSAQAARIILRGLQREKLEIHFPYRLSILAKASRLLSSRFYAALMHDRRKGKPPG